MSDALDLYLRDIKITKMLLNFCGFDIFSEVPKNSLRAYLFVFDLILFNVAQLYSSYCFRENYFALMLCLMSWPLAIMVSKI